MHYKPASGKKILAVFCIFLVIAAGAFFYGQYQERVRAEQAAAAAAEAAAKAAEAAETARLAAERLRAVSIKARKPVLEFERPAPLPPEPRKNILDWQELNPDTIGYLKIEGTKVDYPVVQGTDNEYYLNYTFDHIKATKGAIFLDCSVEFDPLNLPRHLLFHGHHMRDGSMFQNVALYKGEKFFYDHPYISFETLYQETVWQVFSVYVCDSNEYVPMAFRSDETYMAYLDKTAKRTLFPADVALTAEDRIMTLNTCSYEFNGAHTLVVAKLVAVYED